MSKFVDYFPRLFYLVIISIFVDLGARLYFFGDYKELIIEKTQPMGWNYFSWLTQNYSHSNVGLLIVLVIVLCFIGIIKNKFYILISFFLYLIVNLFSHTFYFYFGNGERLLSNFLLILLVNGLIEKTWKKNYLNKLIQVQLVWTYFSAGLHKLLEPTWRNGDVIYLIAKDSVHGSFLLEWISQINSLNLIMANFIILFQLSFIAILFGNSVRKFFYFIGIFFHLFILFFMQIYSFSILPILCLLFLFCWEA